MVGKAAWDWTTNLSDTTGHGRGPEKTPGQVSLHRHAALKGTSGLVAQFGARDAKVVQPEDDSLGELCDEVCVAAQLLHDDLQARVIAYVSTRILGADVENLLGQVAKCLLLAIEILKQLGDSLDAYILIFSLSNDLDVVLVSLVSDAKLLEVSQASLLAGINGDVVRQVDVLMVLHIHHDQSDTV